MSSKRILGISGCKTSGKSTLAQFFMDNASRLFPRRTVRVIDFAGSLKEIVHKILDIPREVLWGEDSVKGAVLPGKNYTAREALQVIGGVFRKFEPECWVNRCLNAAERMGSDLTIIPDVRFPNEIEAIEKRGGIVIRLLRDPYNDPHLSERALDDWKFKYTIDNRELIKEQTATHALAILAKAWGWPIWRD